jgi:hypothetical protein
LKNGFLPHPIIMGIHGSLNGQREFNGRESPELRSDPESLEPDSPLPPTADGNTHDQDPKLKINSPRKQKLDPKNMGLSLSVNPIIVGPKDRTDGPSSDSAAEKRAQREQNATTAKQSWLLRLFESKLFDMSIAITYLFNSKEPGVLTYLGNKLFSFSPDEVDFYLPQLLNMYIHMHDVAEAIHPYIIHRFVLNGNNSSQGWGGSQLSW